MDLLTLLLISSGVLCLLLVILLIVWAVSPQPKMHENRREDARQELRNIKDEIEHEAAAEITPYKPTRLSRPGKQRL